MIVVQLKLSSVFFQFRYLIHVKQFGLSKKHLTKMPIRFAAVPRTTDKQICLVGKAAEDPAVVEAANTFAVPVVTSTTGITSISVSAKILTHI